MGSKRANLTKASFQTAGKNAHIIKYAHFETIFLF